MPGNLHMEHQHSPSLIGIGGPVEGGTFAMAGEEISNGRDHTNALAINDRSVSRRHRCIRRLAAERFEIRDPGSRNGTAVNGLPVTAGSGRRRRDPGSATAIFDSALRRNGVTAIYSPVAVSGTLRGELLVRLSRR